MSTVGRMACTFALMKVLTRSRGTPAAAFARYCSRKVLADTELNDYSIEDARNAGVDWVGTADRRPEVDRVRHGPMGAARVLARMVNVDNGPEFAGRTLEVWAYAAEKGGRSRWFDSFKRRWLG